MPKPTTSRLLPQDHNPEDMWCPYATPEYETMIVPILVPAHSNCVSTELLKLQLILWEISNNPFQSIEQICSTNEEMADTFHQRLTQWALELPVCLAQVGLLESAPIPAILDMQ